MKKLIFVCLILGVATLSFAKDKKHDNGPAFISKIISK